MKSSEIVAEALRLSRPIIRLTSEESGAPVGYWGYYAQGEHLMSVQVALLRSSPVSFPAAGLATLHSNRGGKHRFSLHEGAIVFEALERAIPRIEGRTHPYTGAPMPDVRTWGDLGNQCILLYAKADVSLPCPTELFQFGSEKMKAWVRALEW